MPPNTGQRGPPVRSFGLAGPMRLAAGWPSGGPLCQIVRSRLSDPELVTPNRPKFFNDNNNGQHFCNRSQNIA
jgi:hypothetical protein